MSRDGALQLFDILAFNEPSDPLPYAPGPLNNFTIRNMIAPFWCDIDSAGEITYGLVQSGQTGADVLLSKANVCVRQGFPLMAPAFQSTDLFIATWRSVRAVGGDAQVF